MSERKLDHRHARQIHPIAVPPERDVVPEPRCDLRCVRHTSHPGQHRHVIQRRCSLALNDHVFAEPCRDRPRPQDVFHRLPQPEIGCQREGCNDLSQTQPGVAVTRRHPLDPSEHFVGAERLAQSNRTVVDARTNRRDLRPVTRQFTGGPARPPCHREAEGLSVGIRPFGAHDRNRLVTGLLGPVAESAALMTWRKSPGQRVFSDRWSWGGRTRLWSLRPGTPGKSQSW